MPGVERGERVLLGLNGALVPLSGCRRMGSESAVGQQKEDTVTSGLEGGEDDSIRCRSSQICEGPEACKRSGDKTLACVTDSTARRDRVRDAAKWAWEVRHWQSSESGAGGLSKRDGRVGRE